MSKCRPCDYRCCVLCGIDCPCLYPAALLTLSGPAALPYCTYREVTSPPRQHDNTPHTHTHTSPTRDTFGVYVAMVPWVYRGIMAFPNDSVRPMIACVYLYI